ncbi:MAG: hypothetical protein F4Y86_11520 [Gammaproteobacteria bacterium]|nr:hypothetical protein [Gammaproteobacteria bacterium]MYB38129.1 hypothetical protein [Gammaproteobacteria bacterium]
MAAGGATTAAMAAGGAKAAAKGTYAATSAAEAAAAAKAAEARAAEGGIGANNLFRGETAVTNFDLRLDVAANILRRSMSEDIEVDHQTVNVYGDASYARGGRNIVVEGNHSRRVGNSELTALATHGHIEETVYGPTAMEHYEVEAEAIMAGGYTSFNAMNCMRLLGLADQLCWGGWVEVDGVRTDIALISFRTHLNRCHMVGSRNFRGSMYIDDYILRREMFGTVADNQTNVVEAGGPGSGTIMES